MKHILTYCLIFILGWATGFFISTTLISDYDMGSWEEDTLSLELDHTHETMDENDDHNAAHTAYLVPSGSPVPAIDISVTKDIKSGYNLQINTKNFSFTPEKSSQEHVVNEGHAHLYIDGIKITRVYSESLYIPEDWLTPGENTIVVSLNTNDHMEYTYENQPISDSETIVMAE